MYNVIMVAAGGAFGAVLRYFVAGFVQRSTISPFPWGTLTVNLVGCLLIGAIWAWAQKIDLSTAAVAFLLAGVLGSFTTFSTFSFETIDLFQAGHRVMAVTYICASNILGIGAAWLSYSTIRAWLSV
ncbi:MAG: fluoride efflux transporter CrcB [Rhodothermales bacterium]|nr:fluoride efflux transporter CrcB [Rhodothermales bacterium]